MGNHILRIISISHCVVINYVFLYLIFRPLIFIDVIKIVTLFVIYTFCNNFIFIFNLEKVQLQAQQFNSVILDSRFPQSSPLTGEVSNLFVSWGDDRDQWQFFLGVAETTTFNFFTCKSIFHLSEYHKFEYFSQQWRDIQVCEKIKFMER